MINSKTYLIISPFPSNASHGIHNYNLNLIDFLDKNGFKYDYFTNDDNHKPEEFRKIVYEYVTQNYGIDEVIIEAPEVKASTILLTDYEVKIRIHTPGAIAQKYDYKDVDQTLFAYELQAINQAQFVSSPSYGVIEELSNYVKRKDISYYKNPFNLNIEMSSFDQKDYDIIFMGRFQPLKGTEYINDILLKLPKHYKVVLLGKKSTQHKLDNNIQCEVELIEEISGKERFDLVKKSKVLMQLSNFENCSMVILESLSCGTVCCAWDVGGNAEIAKAPILKITKKGDISSFVNLIKTTIDTEYPSQKLFKEAVQNINHDFETGFKSFLDDNYKIFKGLDFRNTHTYEEIFEKELYKPQGYDKFGERIFGFSISNEHIEEMWMPIIEKFNADYRFVCKRPLGFYYKFKNPYYVDPNKFTQFDWIKYPNLLIEEIKKFKPNKILFHNGIHPIYQEVLRRIKVTFPNIPIVYSELGWYPQKDTIYFDEWGTNGKSKIASLSFQEFCNEEYPKTKRKKKIKGNYVLIVTQLESDTNIIVNSPRFKKTYNFIEYVLSQLPNTEKIIIKTHPLDNLKKNLEVFNNERIEVVHEGDLTELLKNSKAVIGINSTVLLEALQYETNIYMFGDYLLSNKNVVIECSKGGDLKDLWTDEYFSNRKAKDLIIQEFKNRQITIPNLTKYELVDWLKEKSAQPLLKKINIYSKKEEFDILNKKLNPKEKECPEISIQKEKNIKKINKNELTPFEKKFRKLRNNPRKYFEDAKSPIVRIFSIFFKRK